MRFQTIPKKRFGQHFLNSPEVVEKSVRASKAAIGDQVLEIGPGRGVLTTELVKTGAFIYAVEIDNDLSRFLKKRFSATENIEIIDADILGINWQERFFSEGIPLILVANLPYNISSPLFFNLVRYRNYFKSATLLLQKELAARILWSSKTNNSKNYGVLSVMAGNFFESRLLCEVPPKNFSPPPKVDSSLIHLVPKNSPFEREKEFLLFVRNLFQRRRKKLRKTLQMVSPEIFNALPESELTRIGELRPENLSPEEYQILFYQQRYF